jgi:hypothetical protein
MRSVGFRLGKLLIGSAILAVAVPVLFAACRILSLDWVDDAYALWGAGEMVVDYLKDHDGQWPRCWDDLKPYFEAGRSRIAGWSFEEYQRHVDIKWDVDPAALEADARANSGPTFRVIVPKEWLAGSMGGHEPNEILYRYFRERPRR